MSQQPTKDDLSSRLRVTHECTAGFWNSQAMPEDSDILLEAASWIDDMRAHIEALERGEYICRKCGIRKDAEPEVIDDDLTW